MKNDINNNLRLPIQLTRRQLLKAGGLVMVASATATHLFAQNTAPAAAPAAKAFPVPADNRVNTFIAIGTDGQVTAFCGHVDLGTGVRTALAQMVADELDVTFEQVTMVLGHTFKTPDQGPTIASATIQVTAKPLRQAAAQVREQLVALAAQKLGVPATAITTRDGVAHAGGKQTGYGELVQGQNLELPLNTETVLRKPSEYKQMGKSVARVDIPNKVLGALTYVHDLRLPGMVHARVVRPPYAGADAAAPFGSALVSVDKDSVKHLPGILSVVVQGDFVAVVAEREEQAIAAMRQLKVQWKEWAGLPDLSLAGLHKTLTDLPKKDRDLVVEDGALDAIKDSAKVIEAEYVWPYHMHASIGPSCAVARVADGKAEVWSGTQNPHDMRKDVAKLLDMDVDAVNILRMEASGCYGRNGADDVSADAALLAKITGKTVRVQLMREQEHAWEPKGTAQLIRVRGGLDAQGHVTGYDFKTCYPSNGATVLALLLTGKVENKAVVQEMGDRTAVPQYEYPKRHIISQDAAPIARASWMRGVSALPNVFAHECWIDECAYAAGADPIEYRLRYLKDPRAVALVEAVKKQSNWQAGRAFRSPAPAGERLAKGRGFAYARYFHSKFPGYGAAWCVWVIDVVVDRQTGKVSAEKVFVAQDTGAMVNPAGVRHQAHGNIVQSTSRVLKEFVTFDKQGVTALEWGGYPILRFPELPEIDLQLVERPEEAPMGAGESASVPSAAAFSNAIFDATGVRLREVPFIPSRVLAALKSAPAASSAPAANAAAPAASQ
ncbi:xanthine dehydrogenase family protein molybdopterin-binding subunit [Diaphorobacter sp. HDW4A]|uniref:xanthine dehydrogenase family protein molybdopterin-binding subunit n=1 Tax=Diaphorobacter sp. HDW4A TaxID=2714924 RepID=UPI00140AD7C7|nr:molybdopterin cofactor-binding domain-containing protein [Diaphorobacter sp. HDW4A]QIL78529.1 xanthine dehydrogenase family protein molybdopterin-binding subunit [Diaphorobacter sp. HDW4A]